MVEWNSGMAFFFTINEYFEGGGGGGGGDNGCPLPPNQHRQTEPIHMEVGRGPPCMNPCVSVFFCNNFEPPVKSGNSC